MHAHQTKARAQGVAEEDRLSGNSAVSSLYTKTNLVRDRVSRIDRSGCTASLPRPQRRAWTHPFVAWRDGFLILRSNMHAGTMVTALGEKSDVRGALSHAGFASGVWFAAAFVARKGHLLRWGGMSPGPWQFLRRELSAGLRQGVIGGLAAATGYL